MSWSDILKDVGDNYSIEVSDMIEEMSHLMEECVELVDDFYELAERNEDRELTGMLSESSILLEKYIKSQTNMIDKLLEREKRR